MLAVLQTSEDEIGLLPGHAAIAHVRVQPLACMPEPNTADRVVDLAWIRGSADPFRLFGPHPTGLDHLVDPPTEPLRFRPSLIVAAVIHEIDFIETYCRCKGVVSEPASPRPRRP